MNTLKTQLHDTFKSQPSPSKITLWYKIKWNLQIQRKIPDIPKRKAFLFWASLPSLTFTRAPITPRDVRRRYSNGRVLLTVCKNGYRYSGMWAARNWDRVSGCEATHCWREMWWIERLNADLGFTIIMIRICTSIATICNNESHVYLQYQCQSTWCCNNTFRILNVPSQA